MSGAADQQSAEVVEVNANPKILLACTGSVATVRECGESGC